MAPRARSYRCRLCGFTTKSPTDCAAHIFHEHGLPDWARVLWLHFGRRPGLWRMYKDLKEEGVLEVIVE